MEHIIIYVHENAENFLPIAIKEISRKENACIENIITNSDKLLNKKVDAYKISNLEPLAYSRYDTLIVCAPPNTTENLVDLFRKKFKLAAEHCYSYLHPKLGNHVIDWNQITCKKDIFDQLRKKAEELNDLEKFFLSPSAEHRLIHKWMHYFEIYDRHFQKYRNQSPVVMEIGVFHGGSLQMWKDYFGKGVKIIGIDIDEKTKRFEEDGITVEIGSQEDRDFLNVLKDKYPQIDILIDDGGHTMTQQITTFEELFPHISDDGCYLCEDLHTSYWAEYGGGYKNPNSYIEYSKNFIDYIHAWHSQELKENIYTRTMHSLHYYDSILVIEKRKMGYPIDYINHPDETATEINENCFAQNYY